MISNYFKTAIRHLIRQPSYSFINIGGLAIGMSVCILILTYVFYELSFDKFHKKSDQIYRVCIDANIGGAFMDMALTSGPMGPAIAEDFPEVISQTRIVQTRARMLISQEENKFYENDIYYADSTFFNIFSFKLLRGIPDKALTAPNSIILTKKLAKKYFGDEDPIGKVLRINDNSNYTVSGLIENNPSNSHFKFDALMSLSTVVDLPQYGIQKWGAIGISTYILSLLST